MKDAASSSIHFFVRSRRGKHEMHVQVYAPTSPPPTATATRTEKMRDLCNQLTMSVRIHHTTHKSHFLTAYLLTCHKQFIVHFRKYLAIEAM